MRRIVAGRLDHEPGLDQQAQHECRKQCEDYFQRQPIATAHLVRSDRQDLPEGTIVGGAVIAP